MECGAQLIYLNNGRRGNGRRGNYGKVSSHRSNHSARNLAKMNAVTDNSRVQGIQKEMADGSVVSGWFVITFMSPK